MSDENPAALSMLRQRQIIIERQREKIERLEAELAACEQVREATASEYRRLYAELADLRASSVVYKVRCETCGGDGLVDSDESHLRVYCSDCDNGWQLADGVEQIERYRSHHVLILADSFTAEHPITCDLTACDVYARCSNEWEGPPAPPGWYLIDVDTLELSEAEEREIAYVFPARLIEGEA